MTNIVMCPGHLVTLWKREIQDRSPNSEAIIIQSFSQLISLSDKIRKKTTRYRHLWLIISKDIAKLGYEERPAAVWTERNGGVFCCPDCGAPLFYEVIQGSGRNRQKVKHYLRMTDFQKPSLKENNITCKNEVKIWDAKKNEYRYVTCGTKLWMPLTKDNGGSWIRLGKHGWYMRSHLQKIKDQILAKSDLDRNDLSLVSAINDELQGNGTVQKSPRKYPIAKFIRKYFKGCIDYVLLDEIHQLKSGDSLQGEAMGDLVTVGKKVLALTGTLLNGYASGIYYLLYRMFTRRMKKEGYDYGSVMQFVKDYGVTKRVQWYESNNNNVGELSGSQPLKEMPGVSPIVFTKFLLENAAFISLDDIAEALPSYEEIPVPLDMQEDLKEAYSNLETNINNVISTVENGRRVIASMMTLLSVYPDQPYDQPPIIDPKTNDTLISPPNLNVYDRTKERALLSIVQQKLEQGEHVLIYCHWVERTDVSSRLKELLEENSIRVAVLDSTVKSEEREAWIQKQVDNGVQVLMCNPSLVETGLTLLDFTTIIYYQIGFNLYTLRQASRRSWRINQTHDVQVYFLYYKGTVQERALILMASKLQAAMTLEGKFSEEGLQAMSNNEDVMTQLASAITENIKETTDIRVFEKNKHISSTVKERQEIVKHKQNRSSSKKEKAPEDFCLFSPEIKEILRHVQ